MINKKYNKALAFLITSFAFFAFSTNASATTYDQVCFVGDGACHVAGASSDQQIAKTSGYGMISYDNNTKTITCYGTGVVTLKALNSDNIFKVRCVEKTSNGSPSAAVSDLGTDSLRVDVIKQNKRTVDPGLGTNPTGGYGAGAGGVTQVNSGTNIFGKAVQLDGGVCQDYRICKQNVYERDQYMVGANVQYKATAGSSCSNSGSEYTAFCLEAQFPGPAEENGDCLDYTARQIDPTSLYQVSLFALYKSTNGARITDPKTYFAYEAAARLLAYEDSKYQTRSNTGSSSFNNHSAPYRGGVGSCGEVAGEQGDAGLVCQLANNALSEARNMMASGAAEGTLGVRMNQLGGFTPVGSSYQSAFTVTVQNVTSAEQVGFGNLSFSLNGGGITVTQQGTPVYDAGAKTITFTVLIGGIPGKAEGCTNSELNVTLSYSNNADLRSAFMLDAASTTGKGNRQKFAVFAPSEGKVTYKLPLSNCNTPSTNACQPYAALFCNESDKNGVITVNEGAPSEGAPTDWKNCIIGKTDSQGNSYDVVNNSEYVQTEGVESEVLDKIEGYTSDGQPIIDAAFCTVSCKEQYQFVLPGYKEQVKQGTYFSFHTDGNPTTHMVVGINAERKCVSGNVENENYNKRALDIRAQQVDYLNAYLYYYQIYQALLSDSAAARYNHGIHKWYTVKGMRSVDKCDKMQDTSVEELVAQKGWSDKQYIESWNYDGISVNLTLYELVDPSSTEGGELRKVNYTLSNSDLMKPYKEVVKTPEIKKTGAVASLGYNFYSSIYSDYDVFSEGISQVAKYGQEENTDDYWYLNDSTHPEERTRKDLDPSEPGGYKLQKYTETVCDEKPVEEKQPVTVFLEKNANSEEWNQSNIKIKNNDKNQFDKYLEVLGQIEEKMELAKEKYDALIEEIAIQNAAIQECTNYLANFDETNNPYNFNPVITFSYPDQGAYMAMLAPNVLENENPVAPTPTYEKFFCETAPSNPEGVFSCSGGASEQITFKYPFKFELGVPGEQITFAGDAGRKSEEALNPNDKMDEVAYFNAGSVGSRAFYGRTNGFEWYRSATQFYTIAPDGIVTTNKNAQNATIIDTDGRVYPVAINTPEGTYPFYVTFSQIGQFNETGALGRIMGGGNGKAATMSGEAYDQQVCYYQVCRVDDPTCNGTPDTPDTPDTPEKVCSDIKASAVCNNGEKMSYSYNFSDGQFYNCLKALKEADCCNDFQELISDREDGLYSKSVPTDFEEWYGKECNPKSICESFTIISQESYFASSSTLTDNAFINNNGALQLNARAISNNNVFPNGATGINWQTPEAKDVIDHIQEFGDGIFAEDPEYKITLNNQCANAIREYNARQAGNGNGYSNGGFNDYTNDVITTTSEQSLGNLDNKDYGSQVKMSDEFFELLKKNCGFTGKKATGDYPEKVNDGSRVLS